MGKLKHAPPVAAPGCFGGACFSLPIYSRIPTFAALKMRGANVRERLLRPASPLERAARPIARRLQRRSCVLRTISPASADGHWRDRLSGPPARPVSPRAETAAHKIHTGVSV